MPDKITVSEGLGWKQTLTTRHAELVNLRNQNSASVTTRYGSTDTSIKVVPEYDVKALDKRITLLAREIRLLDEATKRSNAATILPDYLRDDAVLGELEDASKSS